MNTAALLIPTILAFTYAAIAGIELGLPVVWLFSPSDRNRLESYFGPVWEVTNVFGVMALVSFIILFARGLPDVMSVLGSTLLLAGGLLALRAILVLCKFYLNLKSRWVMPVLAVVSLSLVGVVVQLPLLLIAGGDRPLSTALSFALGAMVAVTALAALVFSPGAKSDSHIGKIAIWSSLAAVFMIIVNTNYLIIQRPDIVTSNGYLWLFALIPLIILLGALAAAKLRLAGVGLALLLLTQWAIIFVHQSPYLLYPTVLLSDAVTNSTTLWVAFGSTIFFVLLLTPMLVWLYLEAIKPQASVKK